MNSLLRCCFIIASVLALAACASQGDTRSGSAAPAATDNHRQDGTYMFTIERVARRRGVEVQWVNPPLRRASESAPADVE